MRVVHVVKHCKHGHGNAHVAIDLACVQSAEGYKVVYASEGGDYEGLLIDSGVTLSNIPQNQRSMLGMASAVAKLVGICKRFRPDLLHAHMMSGAVVGYGASLATGVPLVTTVHNSFDRHSFLMRLGHRVVAVSEAERDSLISRGYNPRRLKVVLNGPNGSPRESTVQDGPDIVVETPCVTTVCGLHQRKGVGDLLTAFAVVHAEHPEWRLNIVGDGPDREALKKISNDIGIAGSVRFLGSVPSPRSILKQSAIFVLASHAEPCSLAVGEARASACAIVATAVGGTPELLQHGEAGRLVDPGRPDQIARELGLLMSTKATLLEWRARAKAGSEHLYVDRLFRDYDDVYRGLITV